MDILPYLVNSQTGSKILREFYIPSLHEFDPISECIKILQMLQRDEQILILKEIIPIDSSEVIITQIDSIHNPVELYDTFLDLLRKEPTKKINLCQPLAKISKESNEEVQSFFADMLNKQLPLDQSDKFSAKVIEACAFLHTDQFILQLNNAIESRRTDPQRGEYVKQVPA